jgi:hypothetical protein
VTLEANKVTQALVRCYICGSDFHVQAGYIEYECRIVSLCRLCALKALTNFIFKCSCGKYDFLTKYPHRLRILAGRLQLPPATREAMAHGLALVESTTCAACRTQGGETTRTSEDAP